MQCKNRMDVGTTLEADLAASVVPGNEILMAMVCSSLSQATSAAGQAAAEAGLLM